MQNTQSRHLAVEQIEKWFPSAQGQVHALENLNLTLAQGEFVSLVGPSGCGKSTLFSLIAGIELPTAGRILLDGVDITGKPGQVGFMPQKDLLFPWLTVLDNTALGLQLQGVPKQTARAQAQTLFSRFGLNGFEQSYPGALSGGMRQRAALLRTLLTQRSLVLLDEPFGALDALTRSDMQEWLLGIWTEFHPTVLFVTHDVEEAIFLADRVCVMSPRPGHIALQADVPLPRPRTYHDLADAAVIRLKDALLSALKDGRARSLPEGVRKTEDERRTMDDGRRPEAEGEGALRWADVRGVSNPDAADDGRRTNDA